MFMLVCFVLLYWLSYIDFDVGFENFSHFALRLLSFSEVKRPRDCALVRFFDLFEKPSQLSRNSIGSPIRRVPQRHFPREGTIVGQELHLFSLLPLAQ